ncbi:MAG: hypothetical protein EOP49_24585, partial [Sphingobacteriales bacterium]
MKRLLLNLLLTFPLLAGTGIITLKAQTATIAANGTTGSFKTGYVTSGGTLADGNMTVSNASGSTPKGWAVFDLSAAGIPAGATITSATLRINKSAVSGTGASPACSIIAIPSDLSVPALAGQGSTVFTSITGGTTVNTATWTVGTGTVTLNLNAAGISFLQNNASGIISMGLSTTSNRVFTITGYGGTAATKPLLTVNYQTACAGQPAAGTASAPSSVCAGADFTLTATGTTAGTGIDYQWEFFNTATSTWDQLAGATTTSYTVTGGITSATDYRLSTTCINGGAINYSNNVGVSISAPTQCYCSAASDNNDEKINSVIVAGINNPSTGFGTNGYQNFTGITGTMVMGNAYSFSAGINPFYTDDILAVWIDLNQDGVFANPGERMLYVTPSASPATGTITIPMTATPGITRMRVRLVYDETMLPCGVSDYGQVEDYSIDIQSPPTCNGAPTPATISGPSSACPGTSFTLIANGASFGLGISYQWENYNTGTGQWDAIPNATTTSYSSSGIAANQDFRFVTLCSNGGGTDISATFTVGASAFYSCY